jgi:hypothetical protein
MPQSTKLRTAVHFCEGIELTAKTETGTSWKQAISTNLPLRLLL